MAEIETETEEIETIEDDVQLDEEIDSTPEEELEEEEDVETSEDNEISEEPAVEEKRECKGLFAKLPVSEFTQNERYSDRYLKSKGLFKED